MIIIGAPRSGTNMLRDVLTRVPGLSTWPCDEINYIWRYGNAAHASDELAPDLITAKIRRYVRRSFDKIAKKYDSHTVVEKTCANSLRVDFVADILPEARYIVIRRNGFDAAMSAAKRWNARPNPIYVARKLYFVPLRDLPQYIARFAANRILARRSRDGGLPYWGPILDDMDDILSKYTLPQICAIQWRRCVKGADDAFSRMEASVYHEVAYETFVRNPEVELRKILEFLGIVCSDEAASRAISSVTSGNIGSGERTLHALQKQEIMDVAGDMLQRHGYA